MRYTNALEALAKETEVQLEDPHLTKLHDILVQQGDFQGTEDFMAEAVSCKFSQVPYTLRCMMTNVMFYTL